jgi:ribosome-associated toxin RatA of RatAB toxin-antitoxin module
MNVTRTSIDIAAPAAVIYAFAAATPRWPLILPHYRYVRIRERRGMRQTVEMAAWRHIFPLRWIAEQTNDADPPRIRFRHIAGPTRGMDVEWLFEPIRDGTRVTIVHRLDFAFPVFAAFIGKYVVGEYFVAGVAKRTLARMKRVAEATANR